VEAHHILVIVRQALAHIRVVARSIILDILIMGFRPHRRSIILDILITVFLVSVQFIIQVILIMDFLLSLGPLIKVPSIRRILTIAFHLVENLSSLIRHRLRLLVKMQTKLWLQSISHRRGGLQRLMIM
jgi:hypothetical protein